MLLLFFFFFTPFHIYQLFRMIYVDFLFKDEDGNLLETEYGLSAYKDHQTFAIQVSSHFVRSTWSVTRLRKDFRNTNE